MTPETNATDTMAQPGHEVGRARLEHALNDMNVVLSPYAFEVATARVTTASQRNGDVTQTQIEAIVDDVLSSSEILQGVADSFR